MLEVSEAQLFCLQTLVNQRKRSSKKWRLWKDLFNACQDAFHYFINESNLTASESEFMNLKRQKVVYEIKV